MRLSPQERIIGASDQRGGVMAKDSHRDPAQTKSESVADALRGVRVDHAGETSPVSEVDRLAQQLQDQDLQDKETADHPVDTTDPPGTSHQPSQQDLRDRFASSSGSGTGDDSSKSGAVSREVPSEREFRDHLAGGDPSDDDKSPDPTSNPRDALGDLAGRFGSPFDRLVDSTKHSEPGDDPNPYAVKATDKSAVEDAGLAKSADFLHKEGLNPSPTVSGGDNTAIGQMARQAKGQGDDGSSRSTKHTRSDGTRTPTENPECTGGVGG